MGVPTWRVAVLLFASGLCSLIYQMSWFRELRLVFGGSTAASAAVLAIFMGGLGLGGALLGKRADRSPNPLRLYAHLEIGIAVTAALTPFLVELAREIYIRLGGSSALGLTGASVVRIILTAIVLGAPTVLMGGTLPAAAKAVESARDAGRRRLAVLYGTNTIGAVAGAAISTFLLLELYGNRRTLWIAALLNLLVAVAARAMARQADEAVRSDPEAPSEPFADVEAKVEAEAPRAPYPFILGAAAAVGFIFFAMELVWYRMLSPLLGGSTFTFGLILAIALAGIGLGGFLYSLFGQARRPTLLQFAGTCGAEALFIAIPFALGDRIAVLAIFLRELGRFGFEGQLAGWTVITMLVVLLPSIVAGFQFPLLIGLLGSGSHDVGRHAGTAYAWNTAGAIAGSIAGGFGLLPLLTATGTWRLLVVALVVLCLITLALSLRTRVTARQLVPLGLAGAAAALLLAIGPTAAWRHSPIGAGREVIEDVGKHSIPKWLREQRRSIFWDVDGVESSVGLARTNGYAFMVNGKSDGHARFDSGTQVMAGLIGLLSVPEPSRIFVVGLGTGSTAGWLALMPQVERVDVAELEPAILEVAEASTPVNAGALSNPKIHIELGDAREILLTSEDRYDVIFSEPSNPYRAGVATLFTRDFYEAVDARLTEDGVFVHWLQSYEIEPSTVRTVYATLLSVFPAVQTWQSQSHDFVLVASRREPRFEADDMRRLVESPPFSIAMESAWRTGSLEGLMARYVGGTALARALAKDSTIVTNTDDRNVVEFRAARSVGGDVRVDPRDLRGIALAIEAATPPIAGAVDWLNVDDQKVSMFSAAGESPPWPPTVRDDAQRARITAHQLWIEGRLSAAAESWRRAGVTPLNSLERAMVAELASFDAGDAPPRAIGELERLQPIEAAAIRARWFWGQQRVSEAARELERAFVGYRTNPWPLPAIMGRALGLAELIASTDPKEGERLYASLDEPFAVRMLDEQRQRSLVSIARTLTGEPCNPRTVEALDNFEPWFPWERDLLTLRARCYAQSGHPRAGRAERDLIDYLALEPDPLLPQ